jgi:hypothetical protein
MKKLSILSSLLIFVGTLRSEQFQQNIISNTVAQIPDYEIISSTNLDRYEPTFDDLCKKVTFTRSGLICYFKHIYNCDKYAQEVLPLIPFQHMQEFLTHGNNTHQPIMYTKAVFKLFDKKLKATPSISATEFLSFLQKLPTLIQKDLAQADNKKYSIKQLIRSELENQFEQLKANPDLFLDTLSQKIIDLDTAPAYIQKEQLCFTITRFIDTCLSKIMWVASDKHEVWNNFFALGQELVKLNDLGILKDHEDLDDCQWALNTKFCCYLSYTGSQLSRSFFEKARTDLQNGIKHFDMLPEQEDLLKTKTQQLKEAVITSSIKAEARQFGILSEDVILLNNQ